MAPQYDLTAERAAQLVEAMLVFIEKTSRRKLSFSAIVDMNTGTTENPQDRLVAAVIKHDKQTRQEALREARETVLAEILEDIPDNEADESYNLAIGHAAHALDRLASEGGLGC